MKTAVAAAYILMVVLIIGLVALVVCGVLLASQSDIPQQLENLRNFREWVAATSGWFAGLVAIAATILTVNAISLQISKASEQHTDGLPLSGGPVSVLVHDGSRRQGRCLGRG